MQTASVFSALLVALSSLLFFAPAGLAQTDRVGQLISQLKDPDERIRQGAAHALGDIKDPCAIAPLIAGLKDGESSGSAVQRGAPTQPQLDKTLRAARFRERERCDVYIQPYAENRKSYGGPANFS